MPLAPLESDRSFSPRTVSPYREMGAYEILWTDPKATFKSLADRFAREPGSLPSDFVPTAEAQTCAQTVKRKPGDAGIERFGVMVQGSCEYPPTLRDAAHPVACLYYQGWWNLVESPSVAVVGARKVSPEGLARTHHLVRKLVRDDYTVVSGLAAGVDGMAHKTALEAGGRTIAVLGTPLSHVYPKGNTDLQKTIADSFLVISQVPVLRYASQDYRRNRSFFPERNITMSALTQATIIVEASDASGTLIQARAALRQGRKLLILDSCFQDPQLRWPARFAEKGAIRVRDYDDVRRHLSPTVHQNRCSDPPGPCASGAGACLLLPWRVYSGGRLGTQCHQPADSQFQETDGSQGPPRMEIQGPGHRRGSQGLRGGTEGRRPWPHDVCPNPAIKGQQGSAP